MSDFHQRGPITTLPRFSANDLEAREKELSFFARRVPLTLVVPCLVSEMEQPALRGMVEELAKAPYLDTVVISLDRAEEAGYKQARTYFRALKHRVVVLWNDGPPIRELRDEIERRGTKLSEPGKGRAVWMALGYVLAENRARAVAFHDADVVSYNRSLLANLVYPILHPSLEFDFCKAYYARFTKRLHGRATRLLVRPLLQALGDIVGRHPFLSYLAAFRYPLAGEIALNADLLRLLRIPGDWGLEVGLLFEVLRHRSARRICQANVADLFEHKHQVLSPTDPNQGLHRMAVDIVKHVLRTLAAAGVMIDEGTFKGLRVAYHRYGEDAVSDSFAVATFNRLEFDRHSEEETLETFTRALAEGSNQFQEDPLGTPALPNWARVISAFPEVGPRLITAVQELGGELLP
ncbi:MAG: glycosyl transferase [Thermoanaerobaculales bacterium]